MVYFHLTFVAELIYDPVRILQTLPDKSVKWMSLV